MTAPDASIGRLAGQEGDGGQPSFLCIHPHRELYGSDRTFLQAVRALKERWPAARITVLLTGTGALFDAMRVIVDDVRIDDMFVLRRSHFGPKLIAQMPRLASRIATARRMMARYDVTYVNTVVVLDYLLASRTRRRPVLVHVHELPTGLTRTVFSGLLKAANAVLIYISAATRAGYVGLDRKPGVVVWNGGGAKPDMPRESVGDRLNLLLIGRFNAWKGQPLLLDALAMLAPDQRRRLSVRLVGSVFAGQEYFRAAIDDKIAEHALGDCVEVCPFDPDPDRYYGWADVVAVPSTEPEPFGLVAIEAMAAGRAVIAAGHGGLAEIVVDGETGMQIAPGDAGTLAAAIQRYLDDPALIRRHGQAGRARFAAHFDESIYMRGIADVVGTILAGNLPAGGTARTAARYSVPTIAG